VGYKKKKKKETFTAG